MRQSAVTAQAIAIAANSTSTTSNDTDIVASSLESSAKVGACYALPILCGGLVPLPAVEGSTP